MPEANEALTEKQKRFADEYLIDLNARQAAIRAGYAQKSAAQQASRLLTNEKVCEYLAAKREALAVKHDVTIDRIAGELAKIGFCNMQDYMRVGLDGDPYLDFSELTRDQAAALAEVTVEDFKEGRGKDARDVRRVRFKLADKRAALVDLGKHLGMFTERVQAIGKDGKPVDPAAASVVHVYLPSNGRD